MYREDYFPAALPAENKYIESMTKDTRKTILLIIARGWDSHQSELSLYPNLFRRLVDLSKAPLRVRTHNVIEEGEPEVKESDQAVIIGGSPHCLDENLPWMKTLKDFVRGVAETKTKMMGVCFGHQVIAEALGGKVERCSAGGELGEISIDLTELGKGDDMFRKFPTTFTALAAHRDVVTELPKGAEVLAKNTSNEYQALSMGDNIRSIQFHPEMTSGYFYDLIHRYKDTFKDLGLMKDEAHFEEMAKTLTQKDASSMSMRVLINFLEQL